MDSEEGCGPLGTAGTVARPSLGLRPSWGDGASFLASQTLVPWAVTPGTALGNLGRTPLPSFHVGPGGRVTRGGAGEGPAGRTTGAPQPGPGPARATRGSASQTRPSQVTTVCSGGQRTTLRTENAAWVSRLLPIPHHVIQLRARPGWLQPGAGRADRMLGPSLSRACDAHACFTGSEVSGLPAPRAPLPPAVVCVSFRQKAGLGLGCEVGFLV